MKDELQLQVINNTILKSMYCIIELIVSYDTKPVYIACQDEVIYHRVIAKINYDYQNDNYILAASKHTYKLIGLNGFDNTEQIILTL